MAESAPAESTKCFSGILRLILCRGSLPTHPSDQFIESNAKEVRDQFIETSTKEEVKQVPSAPTPGVVARLMGLDSFPDTPLYRRDGTLGSYFRSRSANSIDFFSQLDHTRKQDRQQHRRVLTSVSFREGLNEDYGAFVHNLDKVDETEGCEEELVIKNRPRVKKEKVVRIQNNGKLQERSVNNKQSKKVGIEEQRRLVNVNSTHQKKEYNGKIRANLKERRSTVKLMGCKEALSGSSKNVKKKKDKTIACKVHSDRPRLKKLHPESTIPEVPLHSRKPLASHIVNSKHSYSGDAHCDNGEVRAITKGKVGRKLKNDESCYYKRMVDEICRLTEENVQESWMHEKLEDFEETCQQFGQEILEVLLKQLVDELVTL